MGTRTLKRISLPVVKRGSVHIECHAEITMADYLRFIGDGGKIHSQGFVVRIVRG